MIATSSHTTEPEPAAPIGNYRWTICVLVFLASAIYYLDRAVISLLKSYLEKDFSWSEVDYSNIVVAFHLSYAIGLAFAGRLIDTVGSRVGYGLSIALWSLASVGTHLLATRKVLLLRVRFWASPKRGIFHRPSKW